MTHRLRRMHVAAEVPAFEGEIGGDQNLVAPGRAEDGAIVPDAEGNLAIDAACGRSPSLTNVFN